MSRISKRNDTLDCVKGICILLMVMLHAGGPWSRTINLFHMPLFFCVSGYLWNPKNVQTIEKLIYYVKKKLKTLWMPFVLLNGILLLLNNVFVRLCIYEDSYTLRMIVVNLVKTLVFGYRSLLGTPTWFLASMFFVNIGNAGCVFVLSKLGRYKKYGYCAILLIDIALAQFISSKAYSLPLSLHTCFAAYLAFLIGYALRKFNLSECMGGYEVLVLIASGVILLGLGKIGTISMVGGNIQNVLFFSVALLSGWFFLIYLSKYLPVGIKLCFAFLGKNSIWILLYHLIAFKMVSYLYILATNEEITLLTSFPCIKHENIWILYTLIGVMAPLLLAEIWKKLTEFIGENYGSKG